MDEGTGITRRQTLIGAATLGMAVVASRASTAATAADAGAASGIVFEDSDGSGRRGPASRGIAGVLVSNGRDVVKTDSDGRYPWWRAIPSLSSSHQTSQPLLI
jgi:hypothetical protein